MKKKLKLIIFILFFLFTESGCYNRLETIQTAVCAGVGATLTPDNRIEFTVQLNKPVNPQKTTIFTQQVEILSTKGNSITEAARRVMLALPRVPLWSHADIFIIGGNLARKDLSFLMDFISRNRNLRHDIAVLVSPDNTPEEILNSTCPLSLCSSRGILRILNFQEKNLGSYRKINMYQFFSQLDTPGIDPAVPQVVITKDIKGNNILTIKGMAVFSGRKMVGSLNEMESRGYRLIKTPNKSGGIISIKFPFNHKNEYIDLEIRKLKNSIKPLKKDNKVIIKVKADLYVNIFGIQAEQEILTPEKIGLVEKAAEAAIKKDITSCIKKSQKLNGDILGFGQAIYRYMPEEWEKLEDNWQQIYPLIKWEVEVKVKIKDTYLTHKVYTPQI
ncbi:Ger(x)C family spore germination protein [Thermosyntropha sp.]|uniref:Ger(x)C family spore germination protein n=1 Tax=Thermosyntropha sp. TaxID=2740820 RepID=UPI0025FC6DEC|nr:Ger(x)C family spore germination protein [Thermosyntropha sp.]MBO8159775.1 Ger(x)C family spore germination protein [Thermosyntropha sp.]